LSFLFPESVETPLSVEGRFFFKTDKNSTASSSEKNPVS
jgi:hypothetical protein